MKTRKNALVMLMSMVLVFTLALAGCSTNNKSEPATKAPAVNNGDKEAAPAKQTKPITVSMYDRGNIPPEIGTAEKIYGRNISTNPLWSNTSQFHVGNLFRSSMRCLQQAMGRT